jgi:MFS family permease
MTALSGGPAFAIFVEPMSQDLGIGKSFFGWGHTARTVAVALSAPVIGRIIDRHGARSPLFVAGVVGGAMMVLLAFITGGWQMIAIFGVMGLMGLQGGTGSLYNTVPLAKWFIRKRGQVMAIAFLTTPIGILLLVPLLQLIITYWGWREGILAMAFIGAVPTILIGLLVMRRQPEDMGLLPDGDSADDVARRTGASSLVSSGAPVQRLEEEYPWTRAEALRSPAFWGLGLAYGLMSFSISTVTIFRTPYFIELGFNPQTVAFAAASEAVPALFMGLVLGFFLERLSYRLVAPLGFFLLAGSIVLAIVTTSVWHIFASHVLFGFGIAMVIVTQNTIWPAFFGRAHLGSIRGVALPVTLGIGAIGAPMAGIVKDSTGEYFPAWWIGVGGLLVGMVVISALRQPRPTSATGVVLRDTRGD